MSDDDSIQTRIIKASRVLQAKIGTGPLNMHKVRQCQQVIDNDQTDFAPMGAAYLDEVNDVLDKQKELPPAQFHEQLSRPVMEFKGNAAMFKYPQAGRLADMMLSFIESLDRINQDARDIITAFEQSLRFIMRHELKQPDGPHGQAFEEELGDTCRRYFKRHNVTPVGFFAG